MKLHPPQLLQCAKHADTAEFQLRTARLSSVKEPEVLPEQPEFSRVSPQ